MAQEFLKAIGPTTLTVTNHDGVVGGLKCFKGIDTQYTSIANSDFGTDDRELGDELTFNAEADTGTAHQDVEDLIEGSGMVHCNKAAVEPCHGITFQCWACGHQCPHGGHGFQIQDGLVDLFRRVVWKLLVEVVHVATDGFIPVLTTQISFTPPGVATFVDILL